MLVATFSSSGSLVTNVFNVRGGRSRPGPRYTDHRVQLMSYTGWHRHTRDQSCLQSEDLYFSDFSGLERLGKAIFDVLEVEPKPYNDLITVLSTSQVRNQV